MAMVKALALSTLISAPAPGLAGTSRKVMARSGAMRKRCNMASSRLACIDCCILLYVASQPPTTARVTQTARRRSARDRGDLDITVAAAGDDKCYGAHPGDEKAHRIDNQDHQERIGGADHDSAPGLERNQLIFRA